MRICQTAIYPQREVLDKCVYNTVPTKEDTVGSTRMVTSGFPLSQGSLTEDHTGMFK